MVETPFCHQCGHRAGPEARYCPACGADRSALLAAPPSAPATPSPAAVLQAEDLPCFTWTIRFPMLTNGFFMLDMLKLWSITYLVVGLLFSVICAFTDNVGTIPAMLGILALLVGGLAVLTLLVVLAMFPRGYPARFTVSPYGVRSETVSRVATAATDAAVTVGLLTGSLATAGAGLLAQAQEQMTIPWQSVRRVTEYPHKGVISLSNSWRTMTRLYCRPEDYGTIAGWVRYYQSAAQQGLLPE